MADHKPSKHLLDVPLLRLAVWLDKLKNRSRAPRAMNGQIARLEFTRGIIRRCGVARIVETGTHHATTTRWFAQFGLPVATSEIDLYLAKRSKSRLRMFRNVEVRGADSISALKRLAGEPIDHAAPTLFYLDAHRQDNLPLRDEIELALAHFAKAVLIIDDFAVPDDPGYGFADYGPGKVLTLDYLSRANTPPLMIYFPATASTNETGAKRGAVIVTANAEMASTLDELTLIRRWKD